LLKSFIFAPQILQMQLSEQEIIRRDKLQQLQSLGIDPFPAASFAVNNNAVYIKQNFKGEEMLAKVLVADAKVDEAMTVVDQGIGGARRNSFFLANLYTVKGEVHRARATALAAGAGADPARVVEEKKAAITAFDRSIEIENALREQLRAERARRAREGAQ
jgi:hypothetical protein